MPEFAGSTDVSPVVIWPDADGDAERRHIDVAPTVRGAGTAVHRTHR